MADRSILTLARAHLVNPIVRAVLCSRAMRAYKTRVSRAAVGLANTVSEDDAEELSARPRPLARAAVGTESDLPLLCRISPRRRDFGPAPGGPGG